MEGNFVSPGAFDWDDSELIKIYNDSMMKVKDKIRNNLTHGCSAAKSSKKKCSNSKTSEACGNKVKEWTVGDICQAVYSEDGGIYEAKILEIPDVDMYLVKFIRYENEEIVCRGDLHPSKRGIVQEEQRKAATQDWTVGDTCQAVYSEDGGIYEAKILEIPDVDMYLVKFIGYENEEFVYGGDLHPSKGGLIQEEQRKAAMQDWDVLDYCSAPYTVDGKWYEAQIIGFPGEHTCTARFIGYENVEVVPLNRLRPSGGDMARSQQAELAEGEVKSEEIPDDEISSLSSHYSSVSAASSIRMVRDPVNQSPVISHRTLSQTESNEFIPRVASHERNVRRHRRSSFRPSYSTRPMSPPMIPHSRRGHEDNEAFSALLMSWYMAGYHTGFYQGRNSRSDCSSECCRRRCRE